MELVILGSGAAFAKPAREVRNPSGYALKLKEGLVLFDLGFGNLRQLMRARLDPAHVSDLFISHRHPDHVGDLPAFLFYLKYEARPKSGRLRLWGPEGLKDHLANIQKAHEPWLTPEGYHLDVRELKSGELVSEGSWSLKAVAVPHTTPNLAYRFTSEGKSFVYSGDTGFAWELSELAAGCDLFLLECTKAAGDKYRWHLGLKAAKLLVEKSGCRRAVLTHIAPAAEADVASLKSRKIRVARDLQRFVI